MNQAALLETAKVSLETSQLDQLKQFTRVVADTGDFRVLREYAPEDATTNPSLILKAVQMPEYRELVQKVLVDHRVPASGTGSTKDLMDALMVSFGVEILKVIPGRVSTETSADLSFDTEGLVNQGRRFVELYERQGVPRERVLVKIATTWEGIGAAEQLQREGTHCNMTLLFALPQAVASAEAGATLISPFVGRILDWHRAKTGKSYVPQEDPGIVSVRRIYEYYKRFGYATEIMGASFRNKEEVLELAGCDLLTISPNLLEELRSSKERVEQKLSPALALESSLERMSLDEKQFRWLMNEDAMATEKLAEGIRTFNADAVKLQRYLIDHFR